jgi:hypothetical protein
LKALQAIFGASILAVALMAGCSQHLTPAQQAQQDAQDQLEHQQSAKHFHDVMETSLHICDANGGTESYYVGDGSISVKCVNGLSTFFYPNS